MSVQDDQTGDIYQTDEVLITQQQDETLIQSQQNGYPTYDEYVPQMSQVQQEIYEQICTPPQSNSIAQAQYQSQLSSAKQITNQQPLFKERKLHNPSHKNMQQIGKYTVGLQQSSNLKGKFSFVNQSTSPICESNNNLVPFIPKPPLVNHLPNNSSSPSLRIYNGGKQKRVRSNKEDLLFFRSPYHEKKYLVIRYSDCRSQAKFEYFNIKGNEIYPPEPLKIQEMPNSQLDLFTFKPHINQTVMQRRNSQIQLPVNN